MFTIEEAKAARHTTSVNIPAGASREFGNGSIERAIEERAATLQAETVNGIRAALVQAWNKLTSNDANPAQVKEMTR